MAKICAIHQPNFFPWMGYFDKMMRADVFVYLEAVDYPKSGSGGMGSWTNRVKVDIQGEARWIGCNIQRFSGSKLIKDVEISDDQPWRSKLIKTLKMNYKKAPNFAEAMSLLEPLIFNKVKNLADFNITAIEAIRAYLGIETVTVRQSELTSTGRSTQLLINITREVGCDTYMCGSGAGGYQDDELFAECGLNLQYQKYSPLPYRKDGKFIPGLSAIDFMMHRQNEISDF